MTAAVRLRSPTPSPFLRPSTSRAFTTPVSSTCAGGAAHSRGNPPIDVDAWLERKAWERKYDPNQPRVSRGHPDGGQWTDDPRAPGENQTNPGEEPLSEEELEEVELLAEQAQRMLADAGDPDALLVLAAGGKKPPRLPTSKSGALLFFASFVDRFAKLLMYPGRNSPIWPEVLVLTDAINTLLPQFESFLDQPKDWDDLVADPLYRDFDSFAEFAARYGSAGLFYDWHHLVEQGSGFSLQEINNTRNIVRAPRGRHWLITSYMMKPQRELGGLSPRERLRERHNELAVLMGYDSDNCFTSSYTRHFRQQQKIIDELQARSALVALLPNLQHDEPWVRCLSAATCWDLAPEEAEATLEELAQEP